MMSYVGDSYRFFASLRMTRLRFVVILSEAKDLYESNTISIRFLLLQYTTAKFCDYVLFQRQQLHTPNSTLHTLYSVGCSLSALINPIWPSTRTQTHLALYAPICTRVPASRRKSGSSPAFQEGYSGVSFDLVTA